MSESKTEMGAELSASRNYRYRLWRRWSDSPTWAYVMLNPSTADEYTDDHTLRRCQNIARANGAGGIEVVNLFALRATDPREVKARLDIAVGYRNTAEIATAAEGCSILVAAFGTFPWARAHAELVIKRMQELGHRWHVLGLTAAGWPRHPSRLPGSPAPVAWDGVLQ